MPGAEPVVETENLTPPVPLNYRPTPQTAETSETTGTTETTGTAETTGATETSGTTETTQQHQTSGNRDLYAGREDLPLSYVGATVGTYAGPGAIATAYFVK